VGPFAQNYKIICQKFKKYKNIKILHQPQNILKALIGTKIFISSAGVSIFESSFLKVPTLLLKMNDNQNLVDKNYEQLGHYFNLEKKDLKFSDKIVNIINLMLKNRNQILKMMSKSSIVIKKIKKNYREHLSFIHG
jgi:spore coat polysaccharide biosynthesis predicted glycosyltransferase SpsG